MISLKARYHTLNNASVKTEKDYVLYWLQSTQRVDFNYGLSLAIEYANRYHLPLKVLYIVTPSYPDANRRHYWFMFEGLKRLSQDVEALNSLFCVEVGEFVETITPHLSDAAFMVMDYGYLNHQKAFRETLQKKANTLNLGLVSVESDVIVPVGVAESKCTYSARTIRPKLLKQVDAFLEKPRLEKVKRRLKDQPSSIDINALNDALDITSNVERTKYFTGGRDEGIRRLNVFLDHGLKDYPKSNDPSTKLTSYLSPYLHFGMIAPHEVYLEVSAYSDQYREAVESFLEQLLVRRELAFNFVHYCQGYDQFDAMTYDWAYQTMELHLEDEREYIYTFSELENAKTHDPYFNAAMMEMVKTGYMHNYMRMYWGKKIIEWSQDYKTAYMTIMTLNNRYFLDGRDPNSYASVAWLFGRHDRAWTERAIFGKLRYMNANGLKRKFAIDDYVDYVNKL